MQTLTFYNDLGSIDMGQSAPYYLQLVEGISGLNNEINSIKAPFQDGETVLKTGDNIQSYSQRRNITLTVVIVASDYDTLNTYKRNLTKIFNPKIPSKLKYTNETYEKEIDVVVETTPKFAQDEKNRYYQVFFVSLIAHQPFWLDLNFSGETFSLSLGKFEFPLQLTDSYEIETEGINRTTLSNDGDVETPVYIEFYGPAINPKILNETTGEYIKVTKTLLTGEKLIISTEIGNKYVIFDNGITQTNAFSLLDLNSVFFNLVLGDNVISFTADFGTDTASVFIQYKNRFIGL